MANVASGRMTLGAIFGTVSTTAGAVSSIVTTAAKSVVMLDNLVESSLVEQRKRHALEASTFDERLLLELSSEMTGLKKEADKLCDESPRTAELFNSSYAQLKAVLDGMSAKK